MSKHCDNCNGKYILKEGKYGLFWGCSEYPKCKSTRNFYDLIIDYILENGINIYKWNRVCYKCNNETQVYSYYLGYQLQFIDECFESIWFSIGIGDIKEVDDYLERNIKSIKKCTSYTTRTRYTANTCVNCNSLQGKNYIVDDPHEIANDLYNKNMDKYLVDNYKIKNVDALRKYVKDNISL